MTRPDPQTATYLFIAIIILLLLITALLPKILPKP